MIHKVKNYGENGQTVVVDAKHMSKNWESVRSRDVRKNVDIGDLVEAGGKDYNLIFDNCYRAVKRIVKKALG